MTRGLCPQGVLRAGLLIPLLMSMPAVASGGFSWESHAYVYQPEIVAAPGGACGDANVWCFPLDGDEEYVIASARDATQIASGLRLALWVHAAGPSGFRAGIACDEVELPAEGATTLLVKLLPAGTWHCDWCPPSGGGESLRAVAGCSETASLRTQPTRGTITLGAG